MKATIKGIERVDYWSTKNEKQVQGLNFHVERKVGSVVGSAVEAIYVSDNMLDNLGLMISPDKYKDVIGKTLEVEYNKRGFPESVLIN